MSELKKVLDSHSLIIGDYLRRFSLLDQNVEERGREWIEVFNRQCRLFQHAIAMGHEMLEIEDEKDFYSSILYQNWYNLLEETRERLMIFASQLPNNELATSYTVIKKRRYQ